MAESTGDFTLNISDFGTTTNPDGTPATGPLFGTDQGAAAEDAEPDLWESSKLGDNMYLKPFFESAEKALDLHRANAKFIKDFYELNKALLLAGIDPFFAAIDAILDEIIKLIQDLRGLGFYMLLAQKGFGDMLFRHYDKLISHKAKKLYIKATGK